MRPKYSILNLVALTVGYFIIAKWGLSFAVVNVSASPFWPPTGLALAASVLIGLRVWPAILVGSTLVNLTNMGDLPAAIGIALGNTLEALVGALLVNRFANGQQVFDHPKDIFKFTLFAGVIATAVSATIGVLTLCFFGLAEWQTYWTVWLTWWLGNAGGALIFGPFFILWCREYALNWRVPRVLEMLLIFSTTAFVAYIIFSNFLFEAGHNYPLAFILFPFMIWAAFRLGQREIVTLSVILAMISVHGTTHGLGPFVVPNQNESLLILQAFLIVLTTSKLALSALVLQQKREHALTVVQYLVAHELTQTERFEQAASSILKAVCQHLSWSVGLIWLVNDDSDSLACEACWYAKENLLEEFERNSRSIVYRRGLGLPGRVWESCQPAWIPDVLVDRNFARSDTARAVGLQSGFAFPIFQRAMGQRKCMGVMELFSHQQREADETLIQAFETIGSQIGQVLSQRAAEQEVQERADELARTNADLQQFAYAASHDLREPLRMVSIYSQMIQKKFATQFDSQAEEYIGFIVEGVRRMDSMLKDLLSYTRATSANIEEIKPVDCAMVLEKVKLNLKLTITETNTSIAYEALPIIMVHEVHLLILFQNLIENAIKYKSNQPPIVNISAVQQNDKWLFSVKDNGLGIKPEYQKLVFGVFKRLHGNQYPGTGMGLAICQKIVERYGGTIWLESEFGKGSNFLFTLPLNGTLP